MPTSEIFHYAFFPTALGRVGIAWGPRGISATALPDDLARMTARLTRHLKACESAPPPSIATAVADIAGLLAGDEVTFAPLDFDLRTTSSFERQVYDLTRAIPRGATRTYGALAKDLGDPQLARAVGTALGRNPIPILIPCHRIVGANGKLVGFSAPGKLVTKQRLLEIEGALACKGPSLFDPIEPKRQPDGATTP